MDYRALVARNYQVFLDAERAAQPFDRYWRVAVSQARNDGRSGVLRAGEHS